MTTTPPVSVEGDERLASTCRHAADELGDMDTANRAVGELVRARAAGNAPRVSGRLAGSVRVASVSALDVVIASDLVYAPVINFGWPAHNIVAQPFMTNAMSETQNAAVDLYAARVNGITRDIKGA